MSSELALSADLPRLAIGFAFAVAALGLALLGVELARARASRTRKAAVAATGALAIALLLFAILRPVRVETDGVEVGARVLVVLDGSRSIELPADARRTTRGQVQAEVVRAIEASKGSARVSYLALGRGEASPVTDAARARDDGRVLEPLAPESDLTGALASIAAKGEEPPRAVVVVSDGRLDRPTEAHASERASLGLGVLDAPVHTIALASEAPRDASVRRVRTSGAAVAHQPTKLRVEVSCTGGLACKRLPLTVRELRDRGEPDVLAREEITPDASGLAELEVAITLHRAGPRVVEVSLDTPSGDAVPENDRRFVTLDVARDRIRVLHVAGRPTYDVRALRTWLKSDQSVDVVAFFILRTPGDDVGAPPSELALIPFPVDELFSVHLPSFDAVVLQDFNAEIYGLTKHLPNLTRYIDGGGGLVMVGGPDAFGPGRYARSALAEALPVVLDPSHEEKGSDPAWFAPSLTRAGRAAPVLAPLREAIGAALPEMPGTNLVGPARPGATVLAVHPDRKVAGPSGEEPMPVLALGEYGTGRTIALTVDGTHLLSLSTFAAEQSGRAYGALWDALLGWIMRDPRFESTAIDRPQPCVAGEPATLTLRPLPGAEGTATVEVHRLGTGELAHTATVELDAEGSSTKLALPGLAAGGYSATVRIGGASGAGRSLSPATRVDFACERGGDEWADPRPDVARLEAIARASGGVALRAGDVGSLPWPPPTLVRSRSSSNPIAPPWVWSLVASLVVGAHWIVRRRNGLA